MQFSTLQEAWGEHTFATPYPQLWPEQDRGQWEPQPTDAPIAGAWGYRPPMAGRANNPVADIYMREGIAGILRMLPLQAVDDLKGHLGGSSLHAMAAILMCGFVLLILYDILNRARFPR